MPGLDKDTVEMFETAVNLFVWPTVDSCKLLESMGNPDSFDNQSYPLAVATYLKWKETVYPELPKGEQVDHHIAIAQTALNILHKHAPDHHIHLALNAL